MYYITYTFSFQQCDLLTKIAGRFHIRAKELIRVLKEAIVNGKNSVQAIYDATIRALVEEAKNLTCEEMIDPTVSEGFSELERWFIIKF